MGAKLSPVDGIDSLLKKAEGKEPLFFIDYDGTLTPIVGHPKDALLSPATRNVLEDLSSHFFTDIISGRGLKDLKALVGLKGVYCAGSHGIQIESPDGEEFIYPEALPLREEIAKAYLYLNSKLAHIPGI